MTCEQWNKATAEINKLPKDQQESKMEELYKQLKDDAT